MPQLQVVNNVKQNLTAYYNLLNYVARPDKCRNGYYGMTNVYLNPNCNPEMLVDHQNFELRDFHGKNNRFALHVIVQFAPSESKHLDHQKVLDIAYYIAEHEFPYCICFFGVHDHSCYNGTDQLFLHIDMMILPFHIITGEGYDCGKPGWFKIGADVASYLQRYVPKEDITQPVVYYGRHAQKKDAERIH